MIEKIDRTFIALLAVCFLAIGCNHTVSRTIGQEHIGTKYATLEGYFRAVDMVEEVPGNIQHSVIVDEATLSSVGSGETCMDITLRTARRYDEPISQQSPTCETQSGATGEAIAEDEVVSVYDYTYQGRRQTVAVEAVAADTFMGLSISEPTQRIFRVIEREATVCCPVAAEGGVTLTLKNKRMDYNNVAYKLAFDWILQ